MLPTGYQYTGQYDVDYKELFSFYIALYKTSYPSIEFAVPLILLVIIPYFILVFYFVLMLCSSGN